MITVAAQAEDGAATWVDARGRERLQREVRGAADHDDAREEAIGVEADEPRAQAREEPEVANAAPVRSADVARVVVAAEQQRRQGERHVCVSESRETRPRHAAKLQHREMKPTLVQYEAPGWGVGEVWLDDERTRLPQRAPPPTTQPAQAAQTRLMLAGRLHRVLRRRAGRLRRRELRIDDGFYGDCAAGAARGPRGEVVTYGELAALAGRPGAARAAGTFCARCGSRRSCRVHRVVSASGIGSWGTLGVDYKRRMLALEGVMLEDVAL